MGLNELVCGLELYSLISKVEKRIREWEANGWIKEVKGTRNAWNNPLGAVPKVLGGKTDPKDIRLCVDETNDKAFSGEAHP